MSGVPSESTQAIVVVPKPNSKFGVDVALWERAGDDWRRALQSMNGVVGRNGFAPVGGKREGDGRTPSGVYRIGTAFGYDRVKLPGLEYRQATAGDFWVDDPASPDYNRWVTGKPAKGSFEVLRRDDDAYALAAVIEYNTSPVVPGQGSAIFLHVWGGPDHPTAGCVALARKDLASVLGKLSRARSPVIVLNPAVR